MNAAPGPPPTLLPASEDHHKHSSGSSGQGGRRWHRFLLHPEKQRPGLPGCEIPARLRATHPVPSFPRWLPLSAREPHPKGRHAAGTMPFLPGDGRAPHSSSSPGPSPSACLCAAPARPPEPPATSGSEAERRRGRELGGQRTGARAELDSSGLSPQRRGPVQPQATPRLPVRPQRRSAGSPAPPAPPPPIGPGARAWPGVGRSLVRRPLRTLRRGPAPGPLRPMGGLGRRGRSEGRGAPGRQAGLPPRDPEVPALPLVGVVVRPWLRGGPRLMRGASRLVSHL